MWEPMRWYSTSEDGADMMFLIPIGDRNLEDDVRNTRRIYGKLREEGCES